MSHETIPPAGDERGFALVLVILVMSAVMAMTVAAFATRSNAGLIQRYASRQSVLSAAARAGIETTRSRLNGGDIAYPDSGFVQVEDRVEIFNADTTLIPGVHRSTWVGPSGITSGQFGIFGSVVVEVEDAAGNRVVRRNELRQESFARFAYFTTIEPSNIAFGGGDQIFGPVHSNDDIRIYSSGATFWDQITTAGRIDGKQYGNFPSGYVENAAQIPMPQTRELDGLRSQAQRGGTAFTGSLSGGDGEATMRIEFLTIDLDGDGLGTGENEGFFRVYTSNDLRWVSGDVPSDYGSRGLQNSLNCGHYHANGTFVAADDHPSSGSHSWLNSVTDSRRRCFLGGSDSLSNGFVANDGRGQWLPWNGSTPSQVASRSDAAYLIPLGRSMNPDFKGVIFVDGHVIVSGKVRGRVTLAATGEIIIGDDIVYATDPGAGTCSDILGLFSGQIVRVADNTVNSPIKPRSNYGYYTYDDTKDEFIHAVILSLDEFAVENYDSGSQAKEWCESTQWGRGCLYLTGGIIQRSRGPVGTTAGTGYLKRYSYDACAASDPPPFFPTTGRFTGGTLYELDPVGFDVAALFQGLTPN